MTSKKPNALIIWNHCGDYHIARWQNLVLGGVFNKVFLASLGSSENLYKWKVDSDAVITLSQKPVDGSDIFNRVSNFYSVLKKHNIDYVLISGYGRIEYILFIMLSAWFKKKVILFAESWYDGSKYKQGLKRSFINFFVDGLFVSGERASNHFRNEIGLKSIPIEIGYSAIDNDHFTSKTKNDSFEILCVARYSIEKNLFSLISAFRKSKAYGIYKLVIIGDGPLKNELLSHVSNDHGKVELQEWKSYDELPYYYSNAKYFILPSVFEPWGLVVNEAMAAGKPVLVSKQCGCVPDLLGDDYKFIFDANQEPEITNKINEAISLSQSEYEEESKYVQQRIASYDLNNWTNQLRRIVNHIEQ